MKVRAAAQIWAHACKNGQNKNTTWCVCFLDGLAFLRHIKVVTF